jgi:PAS domain S-box-containing protein
MNLPGSPAYRIKSIQSLFVVGIILLIAIVSLPLLFSGVMIIDNITSKFGSEILNEELNSLIEPIKLRYKTLERIGLEDSQVHLKEIRENALKDLSHYRYKQTGTIFVVGKDRKIVISADFDEPTSQNFDVFFSQIGQAREMIEYQTETQKRIGVTYYYPVWDAHIGLTIDRQELFAPRNLFIQINLTVLLVLIFIASLCALTIHHFIISPILRLAHYAEQVSKGDLRAEIPGKFILELATVKKDIMGMVASLISREKKYRAIFNAPSDAIVLHEAATGKILEANKAIHTMYGYTPEEFLTMNVGDISSGHHPYTMEGAEKRMLQLSQKNHLRFEWHGKKKNGDLFWVDVSLRPFRHEDMQCVLAVVRDIDDQKKATENLAAEKEQLAITLRSIGDGVITTDNQGLVVLVNRVAEELTGWSQQEAAGHSLDEILRLIDIRNGTSIPNPARKVLSTGLQVELSGDTALIARDGTRKEITDSAAPLFDTASQIVGVVLVFRDITEKQRLEKEILKIKKLESIGVLAGGIAHDFNNLLSAILGNINLARLDLERDSRPGKLLLEAEKASLRAQHLTQQLLTFSKGGEPLRETTDLAEIINDNAGFVLRGSPTYYDIDVPDDLWQVDIDQGQIGQVIQNIIINSRQAMDKEGGHIEITATNCTNCVTYAKNKTLSERCVHVTIKDNGPGIHPDILEKIFDPYFTTKEKGSGLGLAICHSIIQKHDGVLLVQSEPEKGTLFTLKLPVAKTVNSPQASTPKSQIRQNNNLRILVMDDEDMLLNIAFEMLTVLGHQVETTTNGAEALTLYQEALEQGIPFDTVIMDLTIPGGMGGKEAGTKLLGLDPQAKIVVASGYSNDPIMANYQDYGFVAMLIKPFLMHDLEKVLATI